MAITKTNKLGLPLYSAGTDPHPGRVDHNTIMQAINDNAMGVKQGLHAERPGAGVAGRTYFSTDRNTAAYDNGTTWVEYVPIGGLAPSGVRAGATGPVLSGAGGNEGMSTKLARADHTHAVPLATDDLPGLLNADMFYLLARMTDSASPSTVVRRDANARVSVGTPTDGAHAATKAYADLVSSNASNLTTGTIPAGRLPLATASVNGAMSAADKAKLDGAGYNAGASKILMTNSLNQVKASAFFVDNVAEQLQYAHALTRKDYVDGLNTAARAYADSLVGTSAAPLAHQHDAADVSSGVFAVARLPLASASAAGAMSAAHFSLLAGATSAATANTLVKNDANGRFQTVTPSAAADVANKGYVDAKKWSGADITTGTVSPDRIANATSTLDGLMPKADKAKLDAATYLATPGALAHRSSDGQILVGTPLVSAAATTKAYVDQQVDTRAPASHKHNAADIDSGVLAYGRVPNLSADSSNTWLSILTSTGGMRIATAGQFYTVSDDGTGTMQTDFAIRANGTPYVRGTAPVYSNDLTRKDYVDTKKWSGADITSGTISPARIANATASLDGLMPKADKAALDEATFNNTPGAIARRGTTGQIYVGTPTSASAAATKAYVDGQDAKQVSIAGQVPSGTIDGVVNTGEYYQASADQVTPANGYPLNGSSGTLKVMQYAGGMGTYVVQHWLSASDARAFFRSSGNGGTTWRPWVEFANTSTATESADGLMFRGDKEKLNAATASKVNDTLVKRNSTGGAVFSAVSVDPPALGTHAANKNYVDGYDVLWSGNLYMDDRHTATLSQNVTSQKNGIILVWSGYLNGAPDNSSFVYTYVPKYHVTSSGYGMSCVLGNGSGATSSTIVKYVYVQNDKILGAAGNETGAGSARVLRAVLSY